MGFRHMTHHVCRSSNSMANAFVFVSVGPVPNIVVDTVSPQLTFSASNFLKILSLRPIWIQTCHARTKRWSSGAAPRVLAPFLLCNHTSWSFIRISTFLIRPKSSLFHLSPNRVTSPVESLHILPSFFFSPWFFNILSHTLKVLYSCSSCKRLKVKRAHPWALNPLCVKWRYNLTAVFAHILTMMSYSGCGHPKCNAAKTIKMSGKDISMHRLPEETSRSFSSLLHCLESLMHYDTNINFQNSEERKSRYLWFGIHTNSSSPNNYNHMLDVKLCWIQWMKIISSI